MSVKLDSTHERVIKLETKFEVYEGLSKKSLTRP
jgi:hypothetical protein